MQKRSTAELLLFLAAVAGAYYYIFHTERGRIWIDRLMNAAADTLDDLLDALENELADLEQPEDAASSQ